MLSARAFISTFNFDMGKGLGNECLEEKGS